MCIRDRDVTTLKSYEVEFRTKGNFRITAFNYGTPPKKRYAVSCGSSGSSARAYLNDEQMANLKTVLLSAKNQM